MIDNYIHYVFAFEINHVGVRQTGIQDKKGCHFPFIPHHLPFITLEYSPALETTPAAFIPTPIA